MSHSLPEPVLLTVTGGLEAGHSFPLPRGTSSFGRAGHHDIVFDHPTVSREVGTIVVSPGDSPSVTVTADERASNPLRVDGRSAVSPTVVPVRHLTTASASARPSPSLRVVLAFGAVRAEVTAAPSNPRPCDTGRVPWFRAPRTMPGSLDGLPVVDLVNIDPATADLRPAGADRERTGPSRRFRTRSRRWGSPPELPAADEVLDQIRHRHDREVQVRREAAPGPADLMHWAAVADQRLWERRRHHVDAFHLRLGLSDLPFVLPGLETSAIARSTRMRSALGAALHLAGPLPDVPVVLPFPPGTVLGLCGPIETARTVARALLLQAVVLHGPADLAVERRGPVFRPHAATSSWTWLRRLPHWAPALAERPPAVPGPARFIVLEDGADRTQLRPDDRGIAIAGSLRDLPRRCSAVVELHDPFGRATLHRFGPAAHPVPFLADGVSLDLAGRAAATLAHFVDPFVRSCPSAGRRPEVA